MGLYRRCGLLGSCVYRGRQAQDSGDDSLDPDHGRKAARRGVPRGTPRSRRATSSATRRCSLSGVKIWDPGIVKTDR
jgi:hypothetical protein